MPRSRSRSPRSPRRDGTARLLAASALLLATSCTFESVRPSDDVGEAPDAAPLPIVVVVTGSNAGEMAADLRRAAVFRQVATGAAPAGSRVLLATAAVRGDKKCGNPDVPARATLGLVPSRNDIGYEYRLDFASPDTGRTLRVEGA